MGKTAISYLAPALLILLLAVVWQGLVAFGLLDPFYVSSPARICQRLAEWLSEMRTLRDAYVTLAEVLVGFVLSILIGLSAALLVTKSRFLENAVSPLLTALNALPRPALAPLFVLWFGIGFLSKLVLVISLVSLVFFFNVVEAIHRMKPIYLFHVRMLGGGNMDQWRHVTLPAVAGAIASSLRLGVAYSIIGAVIGELIAAEAGLGKRIAEAEGQFDSTGILAGIALLCIMALLLDRASAYLHRRIAPWSHMERSS